MALTEVFADFKIKLDLDKLKRGEGATHKVTQALQRGATAVDKYAKGFLDVEKRFTDFAAAGIEVGQKTRDAAIQLNNLGEKARLAQDRVTRLKRGQHELNLQLDRAKQRALGASEQYGWYSQQANVARQRVERLSQAHVRSSESLRRAELSARMADQSFQRQREKVLGLTEALRVEQQAQEGNTRSKVRGTKALRVFGSQVRKTTKDLNGPQGFIAAQDEARRAGEGFFGVMARFRRIFGLLQFSAYIIGIQHFMSSTLQAADAVGKAAARLGVTTDEYQKLTAVAETAGARVEDVERTMHRMSASAFRAGQGSKEAAERYKVLGVEVKDANGNLKEGIPLLVEIGNKLGQMEDKTKRNALAQEILGEAGLKLLPAFANTNATIDEQIEKLEKLAVVYDEDFVRAVEEANDNMMFFRRAAERVKVQVINEIVPAMNQLALIFIKVADNTTRMLKTTETVKAALVVGLGVAFAILTKSATGLIGRFLLLRKILLRLLIPFLILEDIFVFLQGGDSFLGRRIDEIFGEGKAEEAAKELRRIIKEELIPTLKDAVKFLGGLLGFGDEKESEEALSRLESRFEKVMEVAREVTKKFLDWAEEAIPPWVDRVIERLMKLDKIGTILLVGAAVFIGGFPGLVAATVLVAAAKIKGIWEGHWDEMTTYVFMALGAIALKIFGLAALPFIVALAPWLWVIEQLTNNWDTFVEGLEMIWNDFSDFFVDTMKSAGGWLKDFFLGIWDSITAFAKDKLGSIIGMAKSVGGFLGLTDDKPKGAPSPGPALPREGRAPVAQSMTVHNNIRVDANMSGSPPEVARAVRSLPSQIQSRTEGSLRGVQGALGG